MCTKKQLQKLANCSGLDVSDEQIDQILQDHKNGQLIQKYETEYLNGKDSYDGGGREEVTNFVNEEASLLAQDNMSFEGIVAMWIGLKEEQKSDE